MAVLWIWYRHSVCFKSQGFAIDLHKRIKNQKIWLLNDDLFIFTEFYIWKIISLRTAQQLECSDLADSMYNRSNITYGMFEDKVRYLI